MSNNLRWNRPQPSPIQIGHTHLVGPLTTDVPPPAEGDLPPVPVVAHAVELIEARPYRFIEVPPPAAVVVTSDASNRPLVVPAAELPFRPPYVYSTQPLGIPVSPEPPTVVSPQQQEQLFRQSPFTFVAKQPAEPPPSSVVPPEPTIVATQQLPTQQSFVGTTLPKAEPPVAPSATPSRPLVVSAWSPVDPGSASWVSFNADSGILSAANTPNRPLVVRAIELPWAPPQVFVAKIPVAVLLDVTPPIPTIAVGAGIFGGASGFVHRVPQPPFVAPQLPPKPIIVGQVPAPLSLPFIGVSQPKVFAAAPVVGDKATRPLVVPAWTPIDGGSASWVGFNADSGIAATADIPPKPTVVGQTRPLEPQPNVDVWQPKVFAAAPVAGNKAARPVVVSQVDEPPRSVDQIIVWPVVSDAAPPKPIVVDAGPVPTPKSFVYVEAPTVPFTPPPAVPIRPTVVRGEPFPQPTQQPQSFLARVAPPPPPQIVMRPIVVPAQPLPTPYIQSPWVSYTEADPPQVPIQPTVVGQQPIPPQAAFVSTPKGGRWGNPPPNHRIIQPQVVTDMSLPFRPNGWVRVAHGFAEALPLLYEGTVVGGTLEGPRVSGGVMTGSAVGGTVQNGYVTGGVR